MDCLLEMTQVINTARSDYDGDVQAPAADDDTVTDLWPVVQRDSKRSIVH